MLRNQFLLTCFFLFIFLTGMSQEISGVVIDSQTNEPLIGASVYFNNTTLGTTTNSNGEFNLEFNKDLKTQLIISYLGFETFVINDFFFKEDLVVPLIESVNTLDEVALSSTDNWSKELKLEEFKKHFLGKSDAGKSCQILNDEVIDLKYNYKTKTLTGKSKAPIVIENRYLKYSISVELNYFEAKYSYVSKNKKRRRVRLVSYNGSNLFRSISTDSSEDIDLRRGETYLGSSLHFMRALASENLSEEGFEIYMKDGMHARSISHLINITPGYDENGVIVKLYDKLNIMFNESKQSSVECLEKEFYIDNFGNHTPPDKVVFTGDFGNQRMGDTLPLDFFVTTERQTFQKL